MLRGPVDTQSVPCTIQGVSRGRMRSDHGRYLCSGMAKVQPAEFRRSFAMNFSLHTYHCNYKTQVQYAAMDFESARRANASKKREYRENDA